MSESNKDYSVTQGSPLRSINEELYLSTLLSQEGTALRRASKTASADTCLSLGTVQPTSFELSLTRPSLASKEDSPDSLALPAEGAIGPIHAIALAYCACYNANANAVSMESAQLPNYQKLTQGTEKIIVEQTDLEIKKMQDIYSIQKEIEEKIANANFWSQVTLYTSLGLAGLSLLIPVGGWLWDGAVGIWDAVSAARAASLASRTAVEGGANAIELAEMGASRALTAVDGVADVSQAAKDSEIAEEASTLEKAGKGASAAAQTEADLASGVSRTGNIAKGTSSASKSTTLSQEAAKEAAQKASKAFKEKAWDWFRRCLRIGAATLFSTPFLVQGLAQQSLAGSHNQLAGVTSSELTGDDPYGDANTMGYINSLVNEGKNYNQVGQDAANRASGMPLLLVQGLAHILAACSSSLNIFSEMASDLANAV